MISFNRHLATSRAFSVHVGKASTHPEKVQTNTNRYLHPPMHGISLKSRIKFSRGVPPTFGAQGDTLGPFLGLLLAHKVHLSHIVLLIAGEPGDIKMLGQGGLKGCSP
jgi:hypothetical protein